MKKVLFLTYVYPYGYYNASAACSTRIMKELALDSNIEVHCVSYKQGVADKQPYSTIPNVTLHPISLREKKRMSRFFIHLQILLRIPIYPIFSFRRIWNHYESCKKICQKEHFDLIISQCYPEESVIVGAMLKKSNIIDRHVAIFWDNIYGKKPARVIPLRFAQRRQKKLESFIAKYADSLVSLYPLKKFHELNGDLIAAAGKRTYLGIPSIIRPEFPIETSYMSVVKEGMINVLYSGTIIKPKFISNLIDILNCSKFAEKINLIFFSKGVSNDEFDKLRDKFKGTIQSPGYIPVVELLSVYRQVDAFISFPGDVYSICSKCYEYMSYGHPMIVLYNDPDDVNVSTFSEYPLCQSICIEELEVENAKIFDRFIETNLGKSIPFETVESLFISDTPKAYTNLIKNICYAD
ncbi:hypothetical protein [Butyricimonas faecihominis]|jgi:lipoprotein|uniref:hypothetical protein n=1 Tax=Butyricimonas faecihominis TaxID=1472416 RepID=UPI00266F7BB7|nr:hypothetical protein [Butyricimonas faecihominis]